MRKEDWIDINDRLPELDETLSENLVSDIVLVTNGITSYQMIYVKEPYESYWFDLTSDERYPLDFMTHWQEIVLP